MGDDDISTPSNEAQRNAALALSPAAEQFINGMGQMFDAGGVAAIGGRIWGLLLISPEPITAEQMANTLKVSRGSISTNMRMLTQNRIVEKILLTGDRRDYYRIHPDGMSQLMQQQVREAQVILNVVEQGLDAVPAHSAARERVEELADYARFATRYLTQMQEAWRSYKAQKDNPAE